MMQNTHVCMVLFDECTAVNLPELEGEILFIVLEENFIIDRFFYVKENQLVSDICMYFDLTESGLGIFGSGSLWKTLSLITS